MGKLNSERRLGTVRLTLIIWKSRS